MKEKKDTSFFSMNDSTLTKDHVEDRREHMVSPSKNKPSSNQKTHLLKPCFTISIDGSEDRSTSSRPDIKALSLSVSFHGYRLPHIKFKSWAKKMSALHEPTWKKAGIFEAVVASTVRICKDSDLVVGIAEKWCPDTNTFVFPWGEATITLEDVMVLLGFSVLGSPVFASLDSLGEKTKENVEKEWLKIKRAKLGFVTQAVWIKRFMNSSDDELELELELEHVAFLALWLSYFVFLSNYYHIPRDVLSIAVHLSRGIRIALAPPVLAHLYAELTLLKDHIGRFTQARDNTDKLELTSLFKLVQVWTWEIFKEVKPKPNRMLKGEPRLTLWNDLRQPRTIDVRKILANSSMDSFEWRPYTKTLNNWELPKFYPEKAMSVPVGPGLDDELISFARCIKVSELVGIDCVEHYFPNRVASQFGLLQDVPCPVKQNNLSKKEAWRDYNKSIEDLTLFIPSRFAIPRVTSMFCEWWRKSFPQHSLKEKSVGGDYDDMFTSDSKRQHMKRIREKSSMVALDNDEEDDSLTVPKVNDKKYSVGEASEPLCKKCRLEADNNYYSGLASIRADETNPSHPPSAFSGEVGTVVPPVETTKSCDDELDVCGSNVEKITMIDYGSKETVCSLHEDGAIAGDNLIQIKLAVDDTAFTADNNELSPREKLASGGANGDETSKTCKSMFQNPSDETNINISVGDGTQGQECLFDNEDIESEDYMKSYDNAILVSPQETRQTCDDNVYGSNEEKMAMTGESRKEPENLLHEDGAMAGEKVSPNEKQDEPITRQKHASGGPNRDETSDDSNIHKAVGEGVVSNDSPYEKSLQNLKVLASSVEERIAKAQRNVAWLKERKAIRQRKSAAARFI